MSDSGLAWAVAAIAAGAAIYYYNQTDAPEAVSEAVYTPLRPVGTIPVTTIKSGSVWTIEASTVTGNRSSRMGWVRKDHSKDTTTAQRETRELWTVDCNTGGYRILSRVSYTPNDAVSSSFSFEAEEAALEYAIPGTNGEAVKLTLCQQGFDTPLR